MKKNIYNIICLGIFAILCYVSFITTTLAAPNQTECEQKTCFCDKNGSNCKLLDTADNVSNVPYTFDKCGCAGYTADDIGAANYSVCNDERVLNVFRLVGYVIFVSKIVVPLLLILFASIDFGKAVIASDDKAISAAVSMLAKKSIAGVVIFFIPTLVDVVYSLVNSARPIEETFTKCQKCLVDPKGNICTEGMKDYENSH